MNDGISIEVESEKNVFVPVKTYIYLFVKRIFDIIVSIIGCAFLVPIALVIKIVYMLNKDFDSIFFTQTRIGKNGKEFNFYKFRSMVPNADEVLTKLLKKNKKLAREYKKNKKLKNDPRITKMGRVIRKCSIDELPQLINVLKGDMSLIGNRPYLPREQEDMGEDFDIIVSTKPGITGYWQVSGRSEVTFDYRLELEKYYSQNYGFSMDIKIFFRTFKVVFKCKGAK
ncbi:MAG: sugar transferase [Bacilli bacterium]|nr:sugar transferase [Bacilli bacterium]